MGSNVNSTMMDINDDAQSVEKEIFIKHLYSELKETSMVHYKVVDQLIYKYNQLYKEFHISQRICEEEKSQLSNVIEGVKGENIVLKRQIEKLEWFSKHNKTRDCGLLDERNDEPLTTMKRQTIEETESDSLLWTRISSGPEKGDDSGWNPLEFRLNKNLSFANLWNSVTFVFWSLLSVLKTQRTTVSEAGAQTTSSVYGNTAVQTDAADYHTIVVQTNTPTYEVTAVQTDSLVCNVLATQTDSVPCGTAAVQTNADPPADNRTVTLTYNTFSQTDFCCTTDDEAVVVRTGDSVASVYDVSNAAIAVLHTHSVAGVGVEMQTDSSVHDSTAVQTESVGAETIGVHTQSVGTDGIGGTDSTVVQTHLTIAADADVATDPRDSDEGGLSTASVDSPLARETVGVQTEETISTEVKTHLDNSKFAIDKLTDMFGCGDNKVMSNNRAVNLKAVLKKIEQVGFKSLCFQELSFVHQKVIDNSVSLCKKYSSLIEIAVKHLPSWQRGSIKQKQDIVHVFAILDRLIAMKNKEIDTFKIDLASEIQKRKKVEENLLLTQEKCEGLVEKNETLVDTNDDCDRKLMDIDRKYIPKCRKNRFSYDEIISGKFLKFME